MKPETQNRRLEPTGLAKPGETRGLTGTGPGLARQESAGRVFGWFWNRTDPFSRSKPGPLAGYPDPLLTLAKVHDFLVMCHGSQKLRATQKESRAQHKQMTAVGYISDSEEIINASWSNLQHDAAAASKWSDRSPVPPALHAKNHAGEQTQVLNVHQVKRIDLSPVQCDEDSAPECISDTKNWLHCNGDLDDPNHSKNERDADNSFDIALHNAIRDSETPNQWDVSTEQYVAGLILSTQMSKDQAEQLPMKVGTMETRINKWIKTK